MRSMYFGKLLRGIRLLLPAVLAAFVILTVVCGAYAQRPFRRPILQGGAGSFVPGQLVVLLKPGVQEQALRDALPAVNGEILRPLRLKPYYLIRIKTDAVGPALEKATLDAGAKLRGMPGLKGAIPNYYRWKTDTTPNDPMYNQQWHYPLINLPAAWDMAKGSPNVILVSLDTGVDVDHPDLTGRFVGKRNFTVQPNDQDVHDTIGHGTHTTGTMGGSTNNAVGVAGVSFGGCSLFAGKVLQDAGFGTSADIADGIMYAADVLKTPANNVVINMSLGGAVGSDQPDLDVPDEAASLYAAQVKDCVVVMSAGNDFEFGNPASSPARTAQLDPRLFCVAACGRQKEHSDYSTSRAYTTISAPGGNKSDDVISTLPTNQGSYGGKDWQGTSMAAPHVSGLCGLMLSIGASPDQLKAIITSTADTGGRSVPNPDFGFGVIDAAAAVAVAKSAIQLASPTEGQFVYGTAGIQLTAGDITKYVSAKLLVDNSSTPVAQVSGTVMTLPWDTRETDPATGAPKYPNGNHKLRVVVTTTSGPITFIRNVKVDNPIAAITSPATNGFVTQKPSIVGSADGLRVPTYTLEFSRPSAPNTWVPIIANQKSKVSGGEITKWDLAGITDGSATLRLRVKNPDGFEVSATSPVVVDQTPPAIPAGLSAMPTHRTATLNWTASSDPAPGQLTGYNVYRSQQSLSGYSKINTTPVTGTTYVDSSLNNGNTYFYKVAAVDAAGNQSADTDFKDATPQRNGTASGQVAALGGAFLSGAAVSVLQNGTPVADGQTTTDGSGQFTFPGPPGFTAGTYDIKAVKAGFVPGLIQNITLDLGRDALAQNFVLQPQPVIPAGWSVFTLPYDYPGLDITGVVDLAGGLVKFYDPVSGTYVNPGDAAFPKPAPGIAYWVFRGGTPEVTGAGVRRSLTVPIEIPIKRGWNLVGNPYQEPIHWVLNNLVIKRSDTGNSATLSVAVSLGWALDFAWGGPDGKTLLFDRSIIPGVSDTIPAYGAFWFRSEVDGSLLISPPPPGSRAAAASSSQWTMDINARSGSLTSTAYIGVGSTRRVMPGAPEIQPGLTLSLSGDGEGTAEKGYAVDLRTASRPAQSWDLTVKDQENQPVVLTWPGASRVPRGWSLVLTDKSSGQRYNLRNTSSVTLAPSRAAQSLQLELTRDSGQRMLISDLTVNTTRGTVPSITFNLVKEGQATVSIIRANGETVRTLTSRSIRAGQNALVWDTRDNQGKSVAPGVYLVQVRATGDKGDSARAVVSFLVTR